MKAHFTHEYLQNPRHRVSVNLIGAGGTGSQVANALARMDYALYKLGHVGLHVTIYDDDTVSEANIGRQLFCQNEIGINKALVMATRINSFFGTDWVAEECKYGEKEEAKPANITITCVDNVSSRIKIGKLIRKIGGHDEFNPVYWLDFGNATESGQVVLGTVKPVKQPKSKEYKVVKSLKCVDQMFDLTHVKDEDSGPSCSLAEALQKQDLFINSTMAQIGCSLLWKLFYDGLICNQGAFVNLQNLNVNPIKI